MDVRAAETHKGLVASRKMLVAVRRYAGTTSVQPESTFALAKRASYFPSITGTWQGTLPLRFAGAFFAEFFAAIELCVALVGSQFWADRRRLIRR